MTCPAGGVRRPHPAAACVDASGDARRLQTVCADPSCPSMRRPGCRSRARPRRRSTDASLPGRSGARSGRAAGRSRSQGRCRSSVSRDCCRSSPDGTPIPAAGRAVRAAHRVQPCSPWPTSPEAIAYAPAPRIAALAVKAAGGWSERLSDRCWPRRHPEAVSQPETLPSGQARRIAGLLVRQIVWAAPGRSGPNQLKLRKSRRMMGAGAQAACPICRNASLLAGAFFLPACWRGPLVCSIGFPPMKAGRRARPRGRGHACPPARGEIVVPRGAEAEAGG
jgi:hypothetical protein